MTPALLIDDDRLDQMKHDTLAAVHHLDRRRTVRHRGVAAGAAALLVFGTTAGALVVNLAPPAQVNYTADCYGSTDFSSRHGTSAYLPGMRGENTTLTVRERVALAESMCIATWGTGVFGPTQAPSLTTCQLADGRLAVFPSSDPADVLCDTLGLELPHD